MALDDRNLIENINYSGDDSILVPEQQDDDLLLLTNARRKQLPVLEPAIFLLFLSYSLSSTIFQNQVIFQACTVQFGYNKTICSLLGTPNATDAVKAIETTVEPYAATIFMTRTMVEAIIPATCSLFIGPWSDKFGRKPVIVVSSFGMFLAYLTTAVITFIALYMPINPWCYLLSSIPVLLSGGSCSLITGIYCYLTDTTNASDRALRMSFMEGALYLGILFGSLASSYVYYFTSAAILFSISAGISLLAVLNISIFLRESIQYTDGNSATKLEKLRALFDFNLVADMFQTCFKRRENLDRTIIWLLITSLGLSIFVLEGSETVFYLFARLQFGLTIKQYTLYSSICIAIQIVGNVLGIYVLNKFFGMSEIILAVIAYISCFGDYTIKALAVYSWHLYIGAGVAILKTISGPMCRSILTNSIPPSEIGKIHAFTTAIESISPLGSAPLYSFVYSKTIDFYPGAFNLISSGTFFFCVLLLLLVAIFKKRHPTVDYESLVS